MKKSTTMISEVASEDQVEYDANIKATLLKCIESCGIQRLLRALASVYTERAAKRSSPNEKALFASVSNKIRTLAEDIL